MIVGITFVSVAVFIEKNENKDNNELIKGENNDSGDWDN